MVEFSKIGRGERKDFSPEGARRVGPPLPEKRPEPEPPATSCGPLEKDEIEKPPVNVRPLFVKRTQPQRPASGQTFSVSEPSLKGPEAEQDGYHPLLDHASSLVPDAHQIKDASGIYERMLRVARDFFAPEVDFETSDVEPLKAVINDAASSICESNEKLIELAVTHMLKESDSYLFQHSVNVSLISLLIGCGLNYDRQRMVELGLAAFLHDIGMVCYEDMVSVPNKLTQGQYEQIKKHVEKGDAILKKLKNSLSDTILTAQYEIHERLDGSGYPKGKRTIHEYARVIALADAFESMMHPRPFRLRYSIMEVYKRIFEAKNKYDQTMIKVLVDRIGFFPNGSLVQLNTKEVARVMSQNQGSPLRPVIQIVFGPDGERLFDEEIKEVNLVKFPTVHIKKCFLDETNGAGEE